LVYKILAIGDSVVWNTGTSREHKFTTLVQEQLSEKRKEAVELALLARGGSVLCDEPLQKECDEPTEYKAKRAYIFGELGFSYPTIPSQVHVAKLEDGYSDYLNEEKFDSSSWKQHKRDLREKFEKYKSHPPDIIIVNGGTNDIGVLRIFLTPVEFHDWDEFKSALVKLALAAATGSDVLEAQAAAELFDGLFYTKKELKADVKKVFYKRMKKNLTEIAKEFPKSKVIVCGYYPVWTENSFDRVSVRAEVAALFALSASAKGLNLPAWLSYQVLAYGIGYLLKKMLSNRSESFASWSHDYHKQAIDEVNAKYGENIFFVKPDWGKKNGAFAEKSYVWEFKLMGQKLKDLWDPNKAKSLRKTLELFEPYDQMVKERMAALSRIDDSKVELADEVGEWFNYRGSLGHPNIKGSKAIADAIMDKIEKKGI
jgi:lysophospholipase L1-like esterase